jgi:hypothetical protein
MNFGAIRQLVDFSANAFAFALKFPLAWSGLPASPLGGLAQRSHSVMS